MQVQPSAKVEAHHTRMDYSCLYKKDFMFTEQSLILTCNIPSFTQIMFSSNFLIEESIGGKIAGVFKFSYCVFKYLTQF
jgi:hypothetical protein